MTTRTPITDCEAMDNIANVMSGNYWSPDTLETIASYVRATGRQIEDVDA